MAGSRGHSSSRHDNHIHIFTEGKKLKFSITKTVTTAFHLNINEARHEVNIAVEERTLPILFLEKGIK